MKKLLLVVALFVLGHSARAQTVQKTVLGNGLTVLTQENHAAPVVAVRFYVRTGSIYEDKFLGAGLSHLFEHTLFEGTQTRDKRALNDELQAIGGQTNAYTSYDVTCYHVTTAKPYFGRALGVLTDMMRNATFPDAEVKVQQGVIHNEMNIGEDDAGNQLGELFNATAFQTHPVRFPIIGFRKQFDALTRDDILGYYKTHYTPENTILSVAGDVSTAEILASAQKELGDWKRGAVPVEKTLPTEPPQTKARRATVQKDVSQTFLQMGWRTIPLQHPDLYALDTLAQILGGGDSSRLIRELRDRDNLVNGISCYSSTPNYDAGIFAISATLDAGKQAKVENRVRAQIARLKKNGVSASELARAKRQVRASFIFGREGVEEQAEGAAYDELGTNDPNYSRLYVANIEKVNAAQILAVAKKYLRDETITVAAVVPRKKTVSNAPETPQNEAETAKTGVQTPKIEEETPQIEPENGKTAPTEGVAHFTDAMFVHRDAIPMNKNGVPMDKYSKFVHQNGVSMDKHGVLMDKHGVLMDGYSKFVHRNAVLMDKHGELVNGNTTFHQLTAASLCGSLRPKNLGDGDKSPVWSSKSASSPPSPRSLGRKLPHNDAAVSWRNRRDLPKGAIVHQAQFERKDAGFEPKNLVFNAKLGADKLQNVGFTLVDEPTLPKTEKTETQTKIVVLPNGVRLILRASKASPTVSIVAMNLGGVRLEDARKAGVSNLAASLLTRGTKYRGSKPRNADQIAELVDSLGGSLDGFSGYNACGLESNWLASDWKKGLNLVAESFLAPTFAQNEFANLKAQTLSALASQDDDPMTAASLLMRRLYFGNHPYARSPLGQVETVKNLRREDVAAFWRSILIPDATVIAVSGDIDVAQVEKVARFLFGRFQPTVAAPEVPQFQTPPPSFTSRLVEKPGITQSVMWYAFPSIDVKNEDRYAIDVLDAALSGANLPGGRLHEKLRDNQLVYVVHAYDAPGLDAGTFVIYAGTTRENRAKAQEIINEEIARARLKPISAQELERAKSMSISSHAIELQSNGAQARQAASDELFGLGFQNSAVYAAKINAITTEDVLNAAKKYLDKSHGALAIVEPPK